MQSLGVVQDQTDLGALGKGLASSRDDSQKWVQVTQIPGVQPEMDLSTKSRA
jgi:hypothetical protein